MRAAGATSCRLGADQARLQQTTRLQRSFDDGRRSDNRNTRSAVQPPRGLGDDAVNISVRILQPLNDFRPALLVDLPASMGQMPVDSCIEGADTESGQKLRDNPLKEHSRMVKSCARAQLLPFARRSRELQRPSVEVLIGPTLLRGSHVPDTAMPEEDPYMIPNLLRILTDLTSNFDDTGFSPVQNSKSIDANSVAQDEDDDLVQPHLGLLTRMHYLNATLWAADSRQAPVPVAPSTLDRLQNVMDPDRATKTHPV
jgi:hypothetical protein